MSSAFLRYHLYTLTFHILYLFLSYSLSLSLSLSLIKTLWDFNSGGKLDLWTTVITHVIPVKLKVIAHIYVTAGLAFLKFIVYT